MALHFGTGPVLGGGLVALGGAVVIIAGYIKQWVIWKKIEPSSANLI